MRSRDGKRIFRVTDEKAAEMYTVVMQIMQKKKNGRKRFVT